MAHEHTSIIDGFDQNATDPGTVSSMQNLYTPDLLQSQVTYTGRQRSSSTTSEDTIRGSGDVDADPSHPPVISHPSSHANIKKRAKFKPYQRPQANAPPHANAPPQANASPQTNAPPEANTPTEVDYLYAERFLEKCPNSNYTIDDVLEGKELFERGMENMPDGIIIEAILTKKADRKAKSARALATLWENEATKRHAKLLYKLRTDNAQMYADNPAEAFRIEGVLVRRSLEELEDDLESGTVAYCYDKGAFTFADLHLDILKELAAARNLTLSVKDGLEANLAEAGSSKSKSSDG